MRPIPSCARSSATRAARRGLLACKAATSQYSRAGTRCRRKTRSCLLCRRGARQRRSWKTASPERCDPAGVLGLLTGLRTSSTNGALVGSATHQETQPDQTSRKELQRRLTAAGGGFDLMPLSISLSWSAREPERAAAKRVTRRRQLTEAAPRRRSAAVLARQRRFERVFLRGRATPCRSFVGYARA